MIAVIQWHGFFFILFGLLACVFAVGVLLTTNVVRMAANLLVSLTATAVLFILAGAEFVGAMQIMIYVGGTLVLLVFGVMLTAQASFVSMKTAAGEWILGAIVGGSLFFVLAQAAVSIPSWRSGNPQAADLPAAVSKGASPLGAGFLGMRIDEANAGNRVVERKVAGYLLPFEIVSMHLLVVLIGAAFLARGRSQSKDRNASSAMLR
jgi:NADH-quinone oxidoreductase subunit J